MRIFMKLMASLLVASMAMAEESGGEYPAPARAGTSAHIDPETGELIVAPVDAPPVRKLDARMRDQLSQSTEGLEFVTMPDGSIQVDLQGRFQHLNVARIGADGEVTGLCSSQWQQVVDFLTDQALDKQEGER